MNLGSMSRGKMRPPCGDQLTARKLKVISSRSLCADDVEETSIYIAEYKEVLLAILHCIFNLRVCSRP